jgi:solute carrier family 34 (sodium-dependent phosphate cotransporter)
LKEKHQKKKSKFIIFTITKVVLLLCFLYFFIISLDLMTSAFRLIAGHNANKLFNNSLLNNPLAGLMIGLLATVLLQSSSTATSIIGNFKINNKN